jgi:colanic acid biosynthesis glycosyl transferase WcaI
MAHILFISSNYPPEKGAAAVIVRENATRLAQHGHRVTVLTTVPNYPTGIVPPQYRGKLLQREMLDGVEVVRTWSYTSPNRGFARRVLAQLSFGCLASFIGRKAVGSPDMILVYSPPLFNAFAVRLMARFKHAPFFFMVADLYPESAIQFGVLHNPWLIKLMKRLEWSTYMKANKVWVVSDGVRDLLLRRGLPAARMFLLPNGVDTRKFHPIPMEQARAELGWDNRFTVLYAGTHGLAHGLRIILQAAEKLQQRDDIHFVLAGDGEDKQSLMAYAQSHALQHVTFMDAQPYDAMPALYAASNLCIVPLRKVPLLATTLPLKMYEIMACGRPILLGAEGRARQLAEREAGAALAFEQENADALVRGILYLCAHPDVAAQMGERGRSYVESRFSYDHLVSLLDQHIRSETGAIRECEKVLSHLENV